MCASSVLCWPCSHLSCRVCMQVEAKVVAEIDSVVGDRLPGGRAAQLGLRCVTREHWAWGPCIGTSSALSPYLSYHLRTSPPWPPLGCAAGLSDIYAMPYLRTVLAESLRLYPQPPILIRRCVSVCLCVCGGGGGVHPAVA